MIWDGTFNVQCVEHSVILTNVADASTGFVKTTYSDIKTARRGSNASMH